MTTFILATGDYPNIGDALIRRRAIEWTEDWEKSRTVFVGPAPDMWIRQIGLTDNDRILRGKRGLLSLYLLLLASRGKPILQFEPGEVTLTGGKETVREVGFWLLTVIARMRRGLVIRPLRGVRGTNRVAAWIHRSACRMSQCVWWRDEASRVLMTRGEVGPDIAFASDIRDAGMERDLLVVTTRGPRPHPGDDWLEALRTVSRTLNLKIFVLSQVRQDEQRAKEYAGELDAELLEWDDQDDLEREDLLRSIYDRASIVVSDRLHVLILASLSGAIPIEAVPNPASKIRTHFETIGYAGLTLDTSDASSSEIVAHLLHQAGRREELTSAVGSAHDRVHEIRAGVVAKVIALDPSTRA
jgi:hypothetical protein